MKEKRAILNRLPDLIQEVRSEIRWKPGSAARHLLKRKLRGHLSENATLEDYEDAIRSVLTSADATVYLYWHHDVVYPTVVCPLHQDLWLVMFTLNGVMETAFVVENPDSYLRPSMFERIGSLDEVLHES